MLLSAVPQTPISRVAGSANWLFAYRTESFRAAVLSPSHVGLKDSQEPSDAASLPVVDHLVSSYNLFSVRQEGSHGQFSLRC